MDSDTRLCLVCCTLTLADCLVGGVGVLGEEVLPPLEDLAGEVIGLQLELCGGREGEEGWRWALASFPGRMGMKLEHTQLMNVKHVSVCSI